MASIRGLTVNDFWPTDCVLWYMCHRYASVKHMEFTPEDLFPEYHVNYARYTFGFLYYILIML